MGKFLGFVNAYRKYIKDAATKMAPLYARVSSKAALEWTCEMNEAFSSLKEDLNKKVELYLSDFKRDFFLTTDASNFGLGYVLEQLNKNSERVSTWASRFTKT